jgi:hypothetical protein
MTRHIFFAATLAALLITATTPSHAQEHKPELKVEYNRFDDNIQIRLRPMKIAESRTSTLFIGASFGNSGKFIKRPADEAAIHFTSVSDEWQYGTDQTLTLIVDYVRLPLPTVGYDRDTANNRLLESTSVELNYSTLMRIANAKKVEGRLGRREFELPKGVLEGLQQLAERMR